MLLRIFSFFIDPGSGISLKSGGRTKGSLFFTRNSSVVFVFSFRKTLPASVSDEHDAKVKNIKITQKNYSIIDLF